MMNWFMQRACKKHGKTITGFRERAVDALINYRWPGNVREMENMIERAVILADEGGALDLCHLLTAGEEFSAATFVVQKNGALRADDRLGEEEAVTPSALPALADTEARMLRLALAEAGRQSLARLKAAQHQPPDAGLPPAQAQDRGRLTGWTPPARTRLFDPRSPGSLRSIFPRARPERAAGSPKRADLPSRRIPGAAAI